MFPASRFALPAALSVSLSSLAVSAALADGTAATTPPPAGHPHVRSWKEALPPSFGERFSQLLQREAKGHMDLAVVPPASAAPGPPESGSDPRVQRILTRALRGVIEEQLGSLEQHAPLAGFLRVETTTAGMAPVGGDPVPRRFDAGFGLRLDAHPRLQLRTSVGALSGIVEVPLVDPELRVGVEGPLGSAGRASLHAGAGGAHGDWATLSFSFGF
jgi:hypothetical protein